MELEKFDDLTRALSGTSTRRRFGGVLTALGFGTVAGLSLLGAADTEARKRHKKRNRKRNKHHGGNGNDNSGSGGGNGGGNGNGGGHGPTLPICIPDCFGTFGPKHCGDDGCGGTCGASPFLKPICNPVIFTCEPIV